MSVPKWKHRACPCGCGEMADECMNPRGNPLAAFQITDVPSACAHETWRQIGGGLLRCDDCGDRRRAIA